MIQDQEPRQVSAYPLSPFLDVLDGAGDYVRVLILSIIGFPESFIKIKNIKRHGAGDCVRVLI